VPVGPQREIELTFPRASAVASKAASDDVISAPAFESRFAEAFERDLEESIAVSKVSRSADSKRLVRLSKAWSKGELASRALAVTLDPTTWRIAQRDVGPRPNVSVRLLVPGSYARSTSTEPLRDVDIALIYRGSARAGAELDRLADVMTPDVALPSPAVVLQARRNAEARTALMTEFGALTASQVAGFSGSEAKNRSALAGRWRREGRLVAVEHHGTIFYPAFQFDADGRPRRVVEDVLKLLDDPEMSPWQQALWFTTANGWLDGRRPVDLLETEPAAVVAAARDALREPVG
jgi:hypothetical protein